jgi:hypothetical protein
MKCIHCKEQLQDWEIMEQKTLDTHVKTPICYRCWGIEVGP